MLAASPCAARGAKRAKAVLKLCESVGVPESWAMQAAMVAFLLPHASAQLDAMALADSGGVYGTETALPRPEMVGLIAAAEWLMAKNAPKALDFVRALNAWAT